MQKYLTVASRRRLNRLICFYYDKQYNWVGFSARQFYVFQKEYTRCGLTSTLVR